VPIPMSEMPMPAVEAGAEVHEQPEASEETVRENLVQFGSSEFAKTILGFVWGKPPALDLAAEADMHRLLAALAADEYLHSARDISDGGIAVALAQAAFARGIGVTVEQEPSLMSYPLFGMFAEPASTVLATADPEDVEAIQAIAAKHNVMAARIGTTGGKRIELAVYRDVLISAALEDLRRPWAEALENMLSDVVIA